MVHLQCIGVVHKGRPQSGGGEGLVKCGHLWTRGKGIKKMRTSAS